MTIKISAISNGQREWCGDDQSTVGDCGGFMANLTNEHLMPMANLINDLLKVKCSNTIPSSDGITISLSTVDDSIHSCTLASSQICAPVLKIFW